VRWWFLLFLWLSNIFIGEVCYETGPLREINFSAFLKIFVSGADTGHVFEVICDTAPGDSENEDENCSCSSISVKSSLDYFLGVLIDEA